MPNSNSVPDWSATASKKATEFTQPDVMLKLVATIDSRDWPHITMISSNRIANQKEIVWGAFTEGTSKKNVLSNPKQGIFYMTPEMPFKFLQAKVDFKFTREEGKDLERFNQSELMRYFTYVRVHTAYYNEIVSITKVKNLPLGGIVLGILKDMVAKGGLKTGLNEKRLNLIGYRLFSAPIAVRAISYIDPSDGYPLIIPCIPLQACDYTRLVFPFASMKGELLKIPEKTKVAVFGMNFDFVNQVVKGTYLGIQKSRGVKFGVVDIEEVYNSSPPIAGKIYPKLDTRPKVTSFSL